MSDGISILETARAHFAQFERVEIAVPEWGTVIYAKPLTLRERTTLLRKADKPDFHAHVIVARAQDDAGKRLFTAADIPIIMNEVDPVVADRIAAALITSPNVATSDDS